MNRSLARAVAACAALAALVAPSLVDPPAARAAGFGLYEEGARALGTGGAFTARADDPSAIYFNPAGLAHLDGKALLVSPNFITFKSDFAGVAPAPGYGVVEETKGLAVLNASAYYAQGIGRKVAAGIGYYNPYGLEVEWKNPARYSGRAISTFSKITPLYFVPTVAWAPSPTFRVGAGANLVLSKVELRRTLQAYNPLDDRTDDVGTVELPSDQKFGAGFNVGIQWWPCERMRYGATYRSKVSIDYDGEADFTQLPTGNPVFDGIVAAGFPPDQRAATTIAFPAQASAGIGRQFSPAWYGEVNVNWTQWSSFDRLEITFADTPSRNQVVPEDWKDAWNIRGGVEYRKDGTSPWAWRGGYYYDESPQPTEGVGPLLPDANRHGVTGGLGWRNARGTTIDGYVLWILAGERSTGGVNRDDYNGTYKNTSVIAGASLGLTFH